MSDPHFYFPQNCNNTMWRSPDSCNWSTWLLYVFPPTHFSFKYGPIWWELDWSHKYVHMTLHHSITKNDRFRPGRKFMERNVHKHCWLPPIAWNVEEPLLQWLHYQLLLSNVYSPTTSTTDTIVYKDRNKYRRLSSQQRRPPLQLMFWQSNTGSVCQICRLLGRLCIEPMCSYKSDFMSCFIISSHCFICMDLVLDQCAYHIC